MLITKCVRANCMSCKNCRLWENCNTSHIRYSPCVRRRCPRNFDSHCPSLSEEDKGNIVRVLEWSGKITSSSPSSSPSFSHKIGSDIEFYITSIEGNFIPASNLLPAEGEVGCDGRSDTGELRIPCASSPQNLIQNFQRSIKKLKKMIGGRKAKAGAYFSPKSLPMGGHLHFDSSFPLSPDSLFLLDKFIGEPLRNCSNNVAVRKRLENYGGLSQWKSAEHGGWEYRTPQSFLSSRKITELVISIAFYIVENFQKGVDISLLEKLKVHYFLLPKLERREIFPEWNVWGLISFFFSPSDTFAIRPRLEIPQEEGKVEDRNIEIFGLKRDRGNLIVWNIDDILPPFPFFHSLYGGNIPIVKISGMKEGIGLPYAIRQNATEIYRFFDFLKKGLGENIKNQEVCQEVCREEEDFELEEVY